MDGNFPCSWNPIDQVDKLFFSFVGKMKIQAKTWVIWDIHPSWDLLTYMIISFMTTYLGCYLSLSKEPSSVPESGRKNWAYKKAKDANIHRKCMREERDTQRENPRICRGPYIVFSWLWVSSCWSQGRKHLNWLEGIIVPGAYSTLKVMLVPVFTSWSEKTHN